LRAGGAGAGSPGGRGPLGPRTPSTHRNLVGVRLAAQARLGIPKAERAPLCSGEVEDFLVPVMIRMGRGEEGAVLVELRKELTRLYGEFGETVLMFMLKTYRHHSTEALLRAAKASRGRRCRVVSWHERSRPRPSSDGHRPGHPRLRAALYYPLRARCGGNSTGDQPRSQSRDFSVCGGSAWSRHVGGIERLAADRATGIGPGAAAELFPPAFREGEGGGGLI
jgi:hypothetical protein